MVFQTCLLIMAYNCSICAAAIRLIVAARVFDDKSPDLTWNICEIVIWATVEVNLINVSGKFLISILEMFRKDD